MNISDTIIQLAKENNGVITSAAITDYSTLVDHSFRLG